MPAERADPDPGRNARAQTRIQGATLARRPFRVGDVTLGAATPRVSSSARSFRLARTTRIRARGEPVIGPPGFEGARGVHGVRVSVETAAAAIAPGVNGSGTVRPPDQGPIWSL